MMGLGKDGGGYVVWEVGFHCDQLFQVEVLEDRGCSESRLHVLDDHFCSIVEAQFLFLSEFR